MAKADIPAQLKTGSLVQLTPTAVAHGGALVARVHERVVFVRHAVLGETCTARITGAGPKQRFFFAEAVAVKEPSPDRVPHPWPAADALAASQDSPAVGGMEFGHLSDATQLDYKTSVVTEQLHRLGGYPSDHAALTQPTRISVQPRSHWRTRMHFAVDEQGRIAMHPHASNALIPVAETPLADQRINDLGLWRIDFTGVLRVDVAVDSEDTVLLMCTVPADPAQTLAQLKPQLQAAFGTKLGRSVVVLCTAQRKPGRARGTRPQDAALGTCASVQHLHLDGQVLRWTVGPGGFWQIHRGAPEVLAAVVRDYAAVQPGETAFDLYGGAGFFAGILAHDAGAGGRVVTVEGSPVTSANARENLARRGSARTASSQQTDIRAVRSDVEKFLARQPEAAANRTPDVVVLDPSREGAGRAVMDHLVRLAPRRIVYVACDPASLGRDAGYLRASGWELKAVTVVDMYPGTHHVEAVALLELPQPQQ